MIQKPKETHAFPLALLLPAITNPATVTAVLGVLGIGATAVTTGPWFDEQINNLENTAIETAGLMSTDMKENFNIALNNLVNGYTSTLDLSKEFIDEFMGTLTGLLPSSDLTINDLGFTLSGTQIIFNDFRIKFNDYPGYNTSLYFPTMDVLSGVSNHVVRINLTSTIGGLNNYIYFNNNAEAVEFVQAYNNAQKTVPMIMALISQYFPFTYHDLYNNQLDVGNGVNLELDNINDYLLDQMLSNQNKLGLNLGINDLVNLKTADGIPLYVDNVGQVVLRDGRPFDGDLENIVVSHRVPAVTDVAGTLTPTITSDFGVTNIRTGEIVIPNPNPPTPNPPPKVKPETTKPPTGIQRFLPAAVVIVFILFLKAIVFYAIRLFDFILTLPFTPIKPIDNYALQWFMDAKILGIHVYDTVLAFATFAFSLTIYKVIRRIW